MPHAENLLDESEVRTFLSSLAFVREFSIKVVSLKPGFVTIELPFDERFSGPPNLFPASIVGTAGDVAAVASCLTLMPKGWALATLDFTIKMTGVAKGEALRAQTRHRRRRAPPASSCMASGTLPRASWLSLKCQATFATCCSIMSSSAAVARATITIAIRRR